MYSERITTVSAAAASYNLTTLTVVKTELAITDSASDLWITGSITQVSKAISRYCNRAFPVEALTDTFYFSRAYRATQRTPNADALPLSRFPVISITSVTETDDSGTQTTLVQGTDYLLDATPGRLIRLRNDNLQPKQWLNAAEVTVSYLAGFGTLASENDTIPANPGPYTITVANAAAFSIDQGVTYTGGAALAAVTGAPASGQYNVNTATGIYTFAAADTGRAVTPSYGYNQIPDDLVDATLRTLTGRWWARKRDPMLMSRDQANGLGSERYWIPNRDGAFPPEITGLLDSYHVPVIG